MAQSVQQFRVFLSSPGDVHEERKIVRDLIKEALPYSPFIRGRATFDVVSWDDPHAAPGLDARLTPQEAINRKLPKPSECDIVVVILWGRMGTPLPPEITREDGSTYQSGTEWEFEDAINTAKAKSRPTILLYQRTEEPKIGLGDQEFQEKREQYQKVQAFFERFRGDLGSLSGTIATYETIDAFHELLRQQLDSVVSGFLGQDYSEELGVTKAAVETMLGILKEQQVPPEQLEAKLKEIAERHLELTEKLHSLSNSNDEPEITQRREQAAEAIEQGDYDKAADLLEEAVGIDRQAIDEQQDALDRRKLSAAATIAQQGELERTRLNYRKAVEHFAEAASLVPTSEADVRFDYLMKHASILDDQGREFGDNPALVKSIEMYRLILEERTRLRVPLDWARTQNSLGNALRSLGQRESGTERLEQAVDAYRAALLERTRERAPLDWAQTQNNLGNALQNLGERESGTERLEQAVDAYRAALEERTREHVPLQWASTQNNLGLVLWTLGQRESGTERLEQAVDAYRAALEEYTRERVPLQWATTQNNLGSALWTLGQRESGTERLEQAVDAYRAAVKERARERVPLEWAQTQNNLGNALLKLGERESGTERLEQAIDAYRAALQERTRERAPLEWAQTQNNLGNALQNLGERESDTERLEQAVDAYWAALEENTRERVPLEWASTQNNLGIALSTLGERESGVERLEQAVNACRAALKEYARERVPLDWAMTQNNLGEALQALAKKERDIDRLDEAIKSYQNALEVYRVGGGAYFVAYVERNLDSAEALLARFKENTVSK